MAIISKFLATVKQNIEFPVIVLFAASFGYFLLTLGLFSLGGFHFLPVVMGWNLFLAVLPLVFSMLVGFAIQNNRKGFAAMAGILWLLFFPNAPYMITDIIHLHLFEYSGTSGFVQNMVGWSWLLYVSMGILLGITTGMMSMELIYQRLVQRKGRKAAYTSVLVISLLSGYAIFVGRFLRLNSWDVVRPWLMAQKLVKNINGFMVAFTLLMTVYILLVYGLFHLLYSNSPTLNKSK
ncbi:MAG: DUF1361 domain-containing protein [Oscillospiraceae bacterium]|nr:DUF1361 domain-containing protein [Oscillospiraceae bacterium]